MYMLKLKAFKDLIILERIYKYKIIVLFILKFSNFKNIFVNIKKSILI